MTEWIITSSVLIVVVIILRTVLKGKISLRLQYALWALVLVRLLIPGSLFGSALSVMNVVPNETAGIYQEGPGQQVEPPIISAAPATPVIPNTPAVPNVPSEPNTPTVTLPPVVDTPEVPVEVPWGQVLRMVWYAGMVVMALWLIIGNLRFYLRLTRSREIVKFAPPALYVAEGIETPCLFGLFHPSVYVTPEVAADERALAHVLAHEETHYRHKDHIWALLRCVCLVVHWYNPLVWLAAALSRRDSELACDEGAIRRLGEEQRAAYGRTLIGLTCTGVGGLLRTATTMTGSKKSIKERIVLIAKKPKMKLYTLIAVILIAAIAVGCTFTGKETEQQRVVSWMSSLEKEDLEQARLMFMDDGTVEMPLLGEDGAESLRSILQQVREEDLLENNDLDSGDVHLAVPVGEDDVLLFDCLADRTIRIVCDNQEIREEHGFSVVWRLDCPELYSFIIQQMESHEPPEEPQGTVDLEEVAGNYIHEIMEAHAAERTAQLGFAVSVGGVMEYKTLPVGEAAQNLSIEGMEVRYWLSHHLPESEDGSPVYGHIVAYSKFMFFLRQGDSVILLGHTDKENLANVYSTPEMIDKYGDAYTAAAMELYIAYIEQQNEETHALENMIRALLDATMDNSTLVRIKDNTEVELVRNGATMDILKSAAENLQALQDSEPFDSPTGGIYLWLGDSGDRHISFFAGKEPYQVTICYAGDGINESAVTNNPQLYLFLMAAAEMENVELHDLDGDGFLEGIIWPFSGNQRNIVIYDVYGGALQRIDVNETMNCKASEFTGQIANIHPNYSKMVRIVNKAGETDFYKYHDGTFSCIYPLSDAEFSFEADSTQNAVMKFVREVYNNHVRLNIPEGSAYRIKDYAVKSWAINEISADGNAVVGSLEYAFIPEGDILYFSSGNLRKGEGDYAGWWIKSVQFLLKRGADGLWHCNGLPTGGLMLEYEGYRKADMTPSVGMDAAAEAAKIAAGLEHVQYYALFDLNHDGQDEVIIETGTYEQDRIYHFFAFVNGKAVEIGVEYGTHSHLASDGTNLIIAAGHMSVENAYRITWEKGVFRSEQIVFNRYVDRAGYTEWPVELVCHYFWGAVYGNPQIYRCKETDPQKAAERLIAAYVADLTEPDELRTFTVTDYRNIEVSVVPTLEMSEADRSVYNYNLKDSEIGEDHWIVEFTMEYRWIGVLHDPPAGPGNGEYWMEQVHQGSPEGFLLTREGDEFVLQSRYSDRH